MNNPNVSQLQHNQADSDPEETAEWLESLDGLLAERGKDRAKRIVEQLGARLGDAEPAPRGAGPVTTDYVNTISPEDEPAYPGDEELEQRIRSYVQWNASVLVHRAQRPDLAVGGHIATFAGAATLYEVGFEHFFRGRDHASGGDQVFFQGHASPGIYSRAFLEGRLDEAALDGFRQERSRPVGLSSYPHPRLMPEFWQFPTVSMGIGPMNAIYQAQSNRYLQARGIRDTADQHVWAFLGDGEMDEPESRGLLQLAANEGLDNLTFVVNCNLQRLDGPVRGNQKIVQELEGFFRGAGWNVVKVLWGREWDDLFARDREGALTELMNRTPDGDFQTFKAESGAFVREEFFGRDPRTAALVKDYTDEQVWNLRRGGHDFAKVHAGYARSRERNGKPTVVLVKTVKGYQLGPSFEGRMASHQMKKIANDDLLAYRDALRLPISDAEITADPYSPPYVKPAPGSDEETYLLDRRRALGGPVPARRSKYTQIELPKEASYGAARKGSGKQAAATTQVFARVLRDIMRDGEFGKRIVPIIPDEARTFGMDAYFPTQKIYNPHGQQYVSVDRNLLLAYKESESGQILHMGINEAGAVAAFTAAGTAYSTHGEVLVPVYIFYSMFGFQRTGDGFWAAGDQMTRGFVVGATAGRTTLTGEGLQHADGHSPMLAATNPAVVSYDPAYGYELAHIVRDGIERMYGGQHPDPNVMYYLTVYNEPIPQPAEPEGVDVDGILKGMHCVQPAPEGSADPVRILASGVSVPWAREAARVLEEDWGVRAAVWSVTSWTELRREALRADSRSIAEPGAENTEPWFVSRLREQGSGPVVAVSDYMRQVPDQLAQWMPATYRSLGADGFGFSDTRAAARRHFRIDIESIVVRALEALAADGRVDAGTPAQAAQRYALDEIARGRTGGGGGDA
ncbi:pyruvate dehydrogenase (acetyl-transferring), homodimeric type [Gulosibacter sp. 10]|uniref:pyruvate dehydrogenase (acetyl-transferring), homodimeric type n=1 Tax=Gulosibacter sp. 10 TaxID=1255570 RepID=UPI00097ECDA5|nr:pyruvate dehydrogenase (acetyl-transferring), homodimeric type [Gulosibacter sp. 10]SJM69518.1 Pyruvate dehydrogenase E1 component [Gulosibacter sp. 10]